MKRSRFIRLSLLLALPFVVGMMMTALDGHGFQLFRHPIAGKAWVISALPVYWMGLVAVVAAVLHRRELAGFLRRQWKPCVMCLISALAALMILEAGLRIVRPGSELPTFTILKSSEFHHRKPPLQRMYCGQYEGESIVVRTNEDGLRTDYSREEFLKHDMRIAVLGDSFTFGLGVRQEDAFPAVMERLLREAGVDAAVLNAGVISYSPSLESNLFRRVIRHYQPTLTLVILDVSDIGDDYVYEGEIADEGPEGMTFRVPDETFSIGWCDRLAVHRIMPLITTWLGAPLRAVSGRRSGNDGRFGYYDFEIEVGGVKETNRFFVLRHPLSETEQYFRKSLGYLEHLAEDVRAVDSRFLVVVSPRFHHWSDRECPGNWEKGEYALDEPYEYEYFRFFDESSASAGFDMVSLLPAFRAATEFPLVFPQDPHWNPAGHTLVAKTLSDTLSSQH